MLSYLELGSLGYDPKGVVCTVPRRAACHRNRSTARQVAAAEDLVARLRCKVVTMKPPEGLARCGDFSNQFQTTPWKTRGFLPEGHFSYYEGLLAAARICFP